MTRTSDPRPPVYGYSHYHDAVLALCIGSYRGCPFNCAKDGAPNCFHHVAEQECEPAQALPFAEWKAQRES